MKPYILGDKPLPGYTIARFIGQGGFGRVWNCKAPGGAQVALKIIDLHEGQGIKEFSAIRLFKNVRHANLVPITGFWLKDAFDNLISDTESAGTVTLMNKASELLIVMSLCDKSLGDRLHECRKQGLEAIPPEELMEYMLDAARAIDFLNSPRHDLGYGPVAIQHCDIKPQNILIVGGSVQLCDFGLARVLSDNKPVDASVTAYYTSPEMLTDSKPSKSTDQYSLAITYYEMRTGELPFDARLPAAVLGAHLQGRLDFSKVSATEAKVLKKATARDPEKRFPTSMDLVLELRRLLFPHAKFLSSIEIHKADLTPPASDGGEKTTPTPEQVERYRKARLGLWIGLGVVLLVLLAIGAYFLLAPSGTSTTPQPTAPQGK
jgi:serine/threonine protein kinase